MNKNADLVVRCTSLEEALEVSRISTNPIPDQECLKRFHNIYPEYGHLDFVFEGRFANCWGDYADLVSIYFAPNNLPIVSGWEFLGESPEVFPADISLESLLDGGAS